MRNITVNIALALLFASTGDQCLAAAPAKSDELIAARQLIFSSENVDPRTGALPADKVIFSWLSASTFAVSVRGQVFLLDSFVTRLEVEPGRTPFVIADLVDLAPEAILLGHGHGDHADNAAYIGGMTGATIFATEEACGTMQTDFKRMSHDPRIRDIEGRHFPADAKVDCVPVTSAGSKPGTEVVNLDFLEPHACVTSFRHLHSVAVAPDTDFPPTPVEIIVDERDASLFPKGVPLWPNPRDGANEPVDERQFNTQTTRGGAGAVESLFFSFMLRDGGNFAFVFHNTSGALKEGVGRDFDGTPEDGRRIVELLESLAPVDVQLGSAATGNFDNNGLRDLIMYQAALEPRIFIPNHITTGSRAREGSSLSVYAGYVDQLNLMDVPQERRPRLHWLVDPVDYLKPIVFDVDNTSWSSLAKDAVLARYCSSESKR